MISPRKVRPDSIVIHNPTGKEDAELNKLYVETAIDYVAVKLNNGSSGGSTGFQSDDTGIAVIDLTDLVANRDYIKAFYKTPDKYSFGYTGSDFTIRDSIDLIEYRGKKYPVKRVESHFLFNVVRPSIIEVYF